MNANSALRLGILLTVLLAGCDADNGTGPGSGSEYDPERLEGEYSWVLDRWNEGSPEGSPQVQLTWELPRSYRNEPFRVYAGQAGGSFGLIATVTSCKDGVCVYTDTNVSNGRSYDYYVATLDERGGTELGISQTLRMNVPQRPTVTVPGSIVATALDGAAYVQWAASGAVRYLVLSEAETGGAFLIGETDGTSFLDDRAENGTRYRYFIAGVDEVGHVSALTSAVEAIPRPDFFTDIVYATADAPEASGFRFVNSDTENPIRPGASPDAHWRVEASGGSLMIVPTGTTAVTGGTFTTALTCGPGSEADCVDVGAAPGGSDFRNAPVLAESGNTYVMRVTGNDNRTHYAKIRVQGTSVNSAGRRLLIFDWAYQLKPDEPRLNISSR
jgi:hypothetical protein